MTPLAHLVLVTCALALSRAATIKHTDIGEVAPIVPTPEDKQPVIEGNRVRAEGIPVEVVVENVDFSIKANEVADEDDVQRPQVDLRNPGPPQRQEHETQNPENHSEDALKVATIKENIEQARILLKEGFQGVSEDIQNWSSANDQLKIQSNIENFRSMFIEQIKKLDDALHAIAKPQPASEQAGSQVKSEFNKIESRLKVLQDNFNNGVNSLSAGVNLVGALKSDQDQGRQDPAAPVPAPSPAPAQPSPILPQWATSIGNMINESFTNFSTTVQNLFTQGTTPAAAQADQVEATPRPPFQGGPIWNNIAQFFNPSQQGQNVSPPANGGVQGIFSGLAQLIPGFGTTVAPAAVTVNTAAPPAVDTKPTEVKQPAAEKPEVTVAVAPAPVDKPAAPAVQVASQPAAQSQPTPTPAPEGPIRQILTNNPVVQSIAGAVQRITNSITNPERPREKEDKKEDPATKGGFHGRPPNGSGDNNDGSNGGVIQDVQKDDVQIQEESHKIEEEVKPESVGEKTE